MLKIMFQVLGLIGDDAYADLLGLPSIAFYVGAFLFGIIGGWLSKTISPFLTSIFLLLAGIGTLVFTHSLNVEIVGLAAFTLGAGVPYCLHLIGQSDLREHQLMAVSFSTVCLITISEFFGFTIVEASIQLDTAIPDPASANFVGFIVVGILLLGTLQLAHVRMRDESQTRAKSNETLGYLLASFFGYILVLVVLNRYSGQGIPNALIPQDDQAALFRVQDSYYSAFNVAAIVRAAVFVVLIFAILRYKPSVTYFTHVLPKLFILKICFSVVGYMLSSSMVYFYMMIPNFILDLLITGGLISTILVSAWRTLEVIGQWIVYGLLAVPFLVMYTFINSASDVYFYGAIGGVVISYSIYYLWKGNRVDLPEVLEVEEHE
ncbi:MAG: hypothetical protein HWE14_01955 [Flavobacteriia bacterium]|nr:hypothetical protein [Flavobacteriia bacterium]